MDEIKNIDAVTLAFLLEIPKQDANDKIIAYKERSAGNHSLDFNTQYNDAGEGSGVLIQDPKNPEKMIKKYSKNESADVEGLEKYLNLPISFAIKNIRERSLKAKTTSDRILNYPATKLVVNKKTRKLPSSVTVPKYLQSLLTREDCLRIIDLWTAQYPAYIKQGGTFSL